MATERRLFKLSQVIHQRQLDIVIGLDHIHDQHNLSAVMWTLNHSLDKYLLVIFICLALCQINNIFIKAVVSSGERQITLVWHLEILIAVSLE